MSENITIYNASKELGVSEADVRAYVDMGQLKSTDGMIERESLNTLIEKRSKRAAVPAVKKKPQRASMMPIWVLVGLVAIVAIMVFGSFGTGSVPTKSTYPTSKPDRGGETMARIMCQDFVKDNLVSPSSADFGGMFDNRTEATFVSSSNFSAFDLSLDKLGVDSLHSNGVWYVQGSVDADNSFGANIRNDFQCLMDYRESDERWFLIEISIGD